MKSRLDRIKSRYPKKLDYLMIFLELARTPSSVTSPVNILGVFIGLSWVAIRDGKIHVHIVLLSGVKR